MVTEELEIKEEPLDENENIQEMFNNQSEIANLLKPQQLQMELIKEEPVDDIDTLAGENFHIVEEHDQFITVSAADMKTADELQFIEKLQTPNMNTFDSKTVGSCTKCLKKFIKDSALLEHVKRNNCIAKQKCPACPLTFIADSQSFLKHLTLHRDNFFFCTQNCGASFKTFHQCEEHEIQVHKLKNPPKIRYKHFCSYCREGFKTELQLHVHWLQQDKGCGKIMQDVAIHSSLASKTTNNNNVKCAARRCNKDDNDVTAETNIVPPPTTFSITKLRLKSNLPPLPANKRPLEENLSDETLLKRSKFVDNLKSKMSAMLSDNILLNFNNDFEIKEEPLDEDDIMNTTPLSPEVIIKTEEEQAQTNNEMRICENVCEQSVSQTAAIIDQMKMKSLLINNNNEINPEFQGNINCLMPLNVQKNVLSPMPPLQMINNNIINNNHKIIIANNNLNDKIVKNLNNNIIFNCNNNIIPNNVIPLNNGNNNSLKNITNLKFVRLASAPLGGLNNRLPPNIQLISLQQQQNEQQVSIQQQQQSQQLQQEFKVIPAPKMSLQIFKLLPGNALTLKNDQPQQILTTNNGSGLLQQQQQPMNIIKLQKAPIIVGPQIQQNNFQLNKLSTVSPVPVAADGGAPDIENTNTVPSNPDVPAQDEFTRLQAEAMQKAEEHRIQYISKKNLIAIESLPEKKQLIDKLKKQIAKVVVGSEVQSNDKTSVSPPPLMKISKDIEQTIKMPNSPISLYLPIMSSVDVELVEARYKFPDYNYKFICPYCLKDYDIKRCLKSHLTKAHNLTTRDMDKINVQAKPFKQEDVTIKLETSPETAEVPPITHSSSESETSTTINPDNSTSTSPEPIKMSALKIIKPRYVCDKCGRKCSSKTMLNDHISANCSREPQYPCTECPKKFYSLSTLQCHMTIHTGELPHKCSYCEKRFRTRGQVTVHHRTHTGERPFVCQVCSQRFTHRETLIAHLSRHIGMKRYKCYGCDKHFSCISALKTHREIRPDTCGKVKFNPRAIGPRVRVVRGNVIFEPQPEINPYLRSEDPKSVLAELQNQPESVK